MEQVGYLSCSCIIPSEDFKVLIKWVFYMINYSFGLINITLAGILIFFFHVMKVILKRLMFDRLWSLCRKGLQKIYTCYLKMFDQWLDKLNEWMKMTLFHTYLVTHGLCLLKYEKALEKIHEQFTFTRSSYLTHPKGAG